MKKSLVLITLLAGAASVYSQGQVAFYDYATGPNGFKIQIYAFNQADPGVEQTGMTSTSIPTGSTVFNTYPVGYTGTGATQGAYNNEVGSDYSLELYAAAGTLSSFSTATFSAIPSTTENPFTYSSATYAGYWTAASSLITFGGGSGTAGAPTVAYGAPVTLAIAAWYNGGGVYTSLGTASGSGVPYGVSPVGTEDVSNPGGSPPTTASYLPALGAGQTIAGGITSFNLVEIPEPSTIALGVIGASAFLMRLRRKQ